MKAILRLLRWFVGTRPAKVAEPEPMTAMELAFREAQRRG